MSDFRKPLHKLFGVCPVCTNELSNYIEGQCELSNELDDAPPKFVHHFECHCHAAQHIFDDRNWTEECTELSHIESPACNFDDVPSLIREKPLYHARSSGMRLIHKSYLDGTAEGQAVSRNWIFREFAYVAHEGEIYLYLRRTYDHRTEHGAKEAQVFCFGAVEKKYPPPDILRNYMILPYAKSYELSGKKADGHKQHVLESLKKDRFLKFVEITVPDTQTVFTQAFPPCASESDIDEFWEIVRSGRLKRMRN